MTLAPDVPYSIGDSAFGGYVAGLIDTTQGNIDSGDASQVGLRYMLIVAPKSLESSSEQFKTANSAAPAAASTRWDGLSATLSMTTTTYPAARYCNGLTYPSDEGSQWYLPAMDELELLYRNLKPTTASNFTTARKGSETFPAGSSNALNGENPSSDPTSAGYASASPAQTSVALFKAGGAQAFTTTSTSVEWGFWSSTDAGGSTGAYGWMQEMAQGSGYASGRQVAYGKAGAMHVRPVRRVPVSALAKPYGHVIVGGVAKPVASASVIVGGVKKPVAGMSVIVGGVKKPIA